MFTNFLKIFYRNNVKNKLFLFITTIGFAIGLASALLIFIYLYHEYSYESMFSKSNRIFRISVTSQMEDKSVEFAANVPALAPYLKSSIPEIESFVRINRDYINAVARINEKENIVIPSIYTVDTSFFDIFDFPFVHGTAEALMEPNQIIVTETLGKKLFGNSNPMGQVMTLNSHAYKIAAVIKDPPGNTHLKFEALISFITAPDPLVWDDAHSYTYLLLNKNSSIAQVKEKVEDFIRRNEFVVEVEKSLGAKFVSVFHSLPDIHLYSHRHNELSENNNVGLLYVLLSIAVFFLLVSSFNYINIAIATALTRIKEIGLRKVIGASVNEIRLQFFLEAFIIILFSFLMALLLVVLSLGKFSELMEQHLDLSMFTDGKFVLLLVTLIFLVTIISGSYPAFYLSSLNSISIFNKRTTGVKSGHFSLRKILVLLQLSISTGILICTMVAVAQLKYVMNADIGFDKHQILFFEIPNYKYVSFLKQQLLKESNIVSVSASDYSALKAHKDEYVVEENSGEMGIYTFERMSFDHSFANMIKMRIIKGRNFDPNFNSDYQNAFLVNESAVKFFGWSEPIGKKINAKNYDKNGEVVGVVNDASFYSLHQKTAPLIISLSSENESNGELIFIKFKQGNINNLISRIKVHYTEAFGAVPFNYSFLDESYDKLYRSDDRYRKIFSIGAFIMLFVSCLGLYGLSAFMVAKRKSEIGVRKVFGASEFQIILLHTKSFFKLALTGSLFAWPVALYASWHWLNTFTMRTKIHGGFFVAATLICLIVVILTTALHALRLSRINPATAVRE